MLTSSALSWGTNGNKQSQGPLGSRAWRREQRANPQYPVPRLQRAVCPGGGLAEPGAIGPLCSGQLRPSPRRAAEQASEKSCSLGLSWALCGWVKMTLGRAWTKASRALGDRR